MNEVYCMTQISEKKDADYLIESENSDFWRILWTLLRSEPNLCILLGSNVTDMFHVVI